MSYTGLLHVLCVPCCRLQNVAKLCAVSRSSRRGLENTVSKAFRSCSILFLFFKNKPHESKPSYVVFCTLFSSIFDKYKNEVNQHRDRDLSLSLSAYTCLAITVDGGCDAFHTLQEWRGDGFGEGIFEREHTEKVLPHVRGASSFFPPASRLSPGPSGTYVSAYHM